MIQITIKIDGMQCGMCESHINDSIRRALSVKKVTSSHTKGETVILTEEKLKAVIKETGYEFKGMTKMPYEKKGFFSGLWKK